MDEGDFQEKEKMDYPQFWHESYHQISLQFLQSVCVQPRNKGANGISSLHLVDAFIRFWHQSTRIEWPYGNDDLRRVVAMTNQLDDVWMRTKALQHLHLVLEVRNDSWLANNHIVTLPLGPRRKQEGTTIIKSSSRSSDKCKKV
jgi:hypothetical protein